MLGEDDVMIMYKHRKNIQCMGKKEETWVRKRKNDGKKEEQKSNWERFIKVWVMVRATFIVTVVLCMLLWSTCEHFSTCC